MPNDWDGTERRDHVLLGRDQLEALLEECATRGASKCTEYWMAEIGRGVIKKTLLVGGALVAALLAWINSAITITTNTPK